MDIMGSFTGHIEEATKVFSSNAKDLSKVNTHLHRHHRHLDQDHDEMVKITEQIGALSRAQGRLLDQVSTLQDICDHQEEMIATHRAEIGQLRGQMCRCGDVVAPVPESPVGEVRTDDEGLDYRTDVSFRTPEPLVGDGVPYMSLPHLGPMLPPDDIINPAPSRSEEHTSEL